MILSSAAQNSGSQPEHSLIWGEVDVFSGGGYTSWDRNQFLTLNSDEICIWSTIRQALLEFVNANTK
jgi:hypothetical protein